MSDRSTASCAPANLHPVCPDLLRVVWQGHAQQAGHQAHGELLQQVREPDQLRLHVQDQDRGISGRIAQGSFVTFSEKLLPVQPLILCPQMFCDFFNPDTGTYCKRLRVICPEHTKDKVGDREICYTLLYYTRWSGTRSSVGRLSSSESLNGWLCMCFTIDPSRPCRPTSRHM